MDRGARAGSENGDRVAGVDRFVRAEDCSAGVADEHGEPSASNVARNENRFSRAASCLKKRVYVNKDV